MSEIDLRHLQYFVAAAESRSFVKAARLVNVSQPAITKSIQRMERWFGHGLFERGQELKLTEFGATLLGDAKRVLEGFDELRVTANQFGTDWAVTLKVGAGPLVAETLIGVAIGKLLAKHPAFKVQVHVDDYKVFPEMLRDRQIDLFIADITELKEAGDLMIQKLRPSRLQWFCRKGHPLARRKNVSFAEVLAYPVALPHLPLWAREWFADHLTAGLASSAAQPPFHPAAICSSFSTLKQIVLESDAVSALTELGLHGDPQAKELVIIDFEGATPFSNPGIVTLKRRTLPSAAHHLIEKVVAVSENQ